MTIVIKSELTIVTNQSFSIGLTGVNLKMPLRSYADPSVYYPPSEYGLVMNMYEDMMLGHIWRHGKCRFVAINYIVSNAKEWKLIREDHTVSVQPQPFPFEGVKKSLIPREAEFMREIFELKSEVPNDHPLCRNIDYIVDHTSVWLSDHPL